MPASRIRLFTAFAAVYTIWGSTYLAIRFAIETVPPFLMAGVRFVIAGAVLWIWARLRGAPRPSLANWGAAAVVGGLMLIGGNGSVVWAEQRVPSGLAALFSLTPFWMVLFDWARPGGRRPRAAIIAGLLCGFFGLLLLVGPVDLLHGRMAIDPLGAAVLALGSLAWAAGSIYTIRGARLPGSWILATGMQMAIGGALLLVLAGMTHEYSHFNASAVTPKSWIAVAYLIVFGAIIGYGAYVYLLRHTTPSRASTYAYVNPVIAVLLGWIFAGESLNARVMLAAVAIVAAVALIITHRAPLSAATASGQEGEPPLEEPSVVT
ncbi:MAG: EamA family transporter [Gemmatimonadetes bacterium]|nr:EamA family transporter [Gemmatimonadota bacterium]